MGTCLHFDSRVGKWGGCECRPRARPGGPPLWGGSGGWSGLPQGQALAWEGYRYITFPSRLGPVASLLLARDGAWHHALATQPGWAAEPADATKSPKAFPETRYFSKFRVSNGPRRARVFRNHSSSHVRDRESEARWPGPEGEPRAVLGPCVRSGACRRDFGATFPCWVTRTRLKLLRHGAHFEAKIRDETLVLKGPN